MTRFEVAKRIAALGAVRSKRALAGGMKLRHLARRAEERLLSLGGRAAPADDGAGQARFSADPRWPGSVRRRLAELPPGFITGYSLHAESARWLYWYAVSARPRGILEAGCGVSTVVLALAAQRLASRGAAFRFTSLESEEQWLEITRGALAALGLEAFVDLRHVPLVPSSWRGLPCESFDPARVADVRGTELLFVDAPPQAVGRGPVPSHVRGCLVPGCLVVLDDAVRDSEQAAAAAWEEDGEARFLGFLPVGRGLALAEIR